MNRAVNINIINRINGFSALFTRFNSSTSKCWSCQRILTELEMKSFFCPCDLKKILPVNKSQNYFQLFNLNTNYKIDKSVLTKNFRQSMRKLHPDLYTQKSDVIYIYF